MSTQPSDPAAEPHHAAELLRAIAALEAQRPLLGDAVVDAAVVAMRARLAALDAPPQQRRQVTVVFADVVGFTALAETRDAEVVAQVMNDLWQHVDAVILSHGGHIDKHIGDAVMAVWGLDAAREDDAERAVRAALAMQTAVDQCCRLSHAPLTLRVGVHTGPVLAGRVGTGGETTVMGDTVNLASRVEGAAPAGSVLITHATYRHVRGVFDVQPRDPLIVRGVAERVVVYLVRGVKPRAFRLGARGIEGIETRMIGRDAELRALQDAFAALIARRAGALLIVADAGLGKSRLLYEFDTWVELRPEEVIYFKGRAAPATRDVGFALWRDLFANRFDILDSDSPAVALGKFRAGFESGQATSPLNTGLLATGLLNTDPAAIVGHWLGFDFDASPAVARLLGSPEFAATARAHLLRYFRALAAADPVVVFLEDLHWADEPSLQLAVELLAQLREAGAPVLFIGAARPTLAERPGWADGLPGFARLDIHPLSGDATRALVDEVLQRVEHLPVRLREQIAVASEGNPFYVEEYVKMLIEQGAINRVTSDELRVTGEDAPHSSLVAPHASLDEPWRVVVERLAGLRVPTTLVGLIQARLDALPAAERRALQHAAVIGRLFWDDAVCWLDEADARPALAAARARELVFRRERSAFAGAEEYTFKHALLRDVAYETVLLRDRRTLHSRAARWLESHAGERLDEYLGLLADHCLAAGETARALAFLARAGELALASGNHASARLLLERAARLGELTPAALVLLGEACFMLSDYDAAETVLRRARGKESSAPDPLTTTPLNTDLLIPDTAALYWLSRVATARGNFAAAAELLARALPAARVLGGIHLARTLEGLAGAAGSRGELDEASRLAAESLALARAGGDRALEMRALGLMGTFARLRDDLDAAEDHFTAARALARAAGNLEREATALINLGDLAYRRGGYDAAADFAGAALDLFHDQGQPDAVAMAAGNLAQAELRRGDQGAAHAAARRALAAARAARATPLRLFALSVYAQVIAGTRPRTARALLRLVRDHPATEFQDRQEAERELGV